MYEKDMTMAMEQFVKDIKKYEMDGMDFKYFCSFLRVTAKDGGANVAEVAKMYLNGSCRVNLSHHSEMLANNWNGDVENVPEPFVDGEQYLLQVYLF